MPVGYIKRFDRGIPIRVLIGVSAGGRYDLTDHYGNVNMFLTFSLVEDMTDAQTTIKIPNSVGYAVEANDIISVDQEFMLATSLASSDSSYQTWNITRGYDPANLPASWISPIDVNGQGSNPYVISENCVFVIGLPGTIGNRTITLTAAVTSGNKTLGDLIADLRSALNAAGVTSTYLTLSNHGDRIYFHTPNTGAAQEMRISTVNEPAFTELGIVPAYALGRTVPSSDAAQHFTGDVAKVRQFSQPLIIRSPPEDGEVEFLVMDRTADNINAVTYEFEFEVFTPAGRSFTVPTSGTLDVQFLLDLNAATDD